MYTDKAKIIIKAGDGGKGAISFYTEKYVPNGGPDGGDGGAGGDIIFKADKNKSSLLDFRFARRFKAEDGENGSGKYCHGKSGKSLTILVPPGTIIRDEQTGGIIADMFTPDFEITVLRGGRGGKGNARYRTSRRQAPRFSQSGERTDEKTVTLEYKTIADVGLIGYPNVGKSTLLSVMSSARPKIANYHFTTLHPNLGIVNRYDNSFIAADIPGLIQGAAGGAGLGHEFLRHIERTRLLVHVVDVSGSEGRNALDDYKTINKELKTYNPVLAKLPQIIALNKCDLVADKSIIKQFKQGVRGKRIVEISAVSHQNIDGLIDQIFNTLKSLPPLAPLEYQPFIYEARDKESFWVKKIGADFYEIYGGLIEEIARGIIVDDIDSFNYFQKQLKDKGVIKELKRQGLKDGDSVRILDFEFDYKE